jgi:hypothetical protein
VTDATVAIAEIAAAMGRRHAEVERKAAVLGMLVKSDWQGRPALPVADARGLATGEGRRNLEHDRAWAQHQTVCRYATCLLRPTMAPTSGGRRLRLRHIA